MVPPQHPPRHLGTTPPTLPLVGLRRSFVSTARPKSVDGSGGECCALVGPFERPGGAIVVVDEGQHLGGEVVDRGEGASAEELAGEDREPDLDLVEPGAVVRGVVEDDPMGGI